MTLKITIAGAASPERDDAVRRLQDVFMSLADRPLSRDVEIRVVDEALVFPSEIKVWPRDKEGRLPDAVAAALSMAAQPWNLHLIYRTLQARGDLIESRAEAELSAALHFLVVHALRDPVNWADNSMAELRAINSANLERDNGKA